MNKFLLQRSSAETGCDLSALAIARDRRLRAFYEAYMKAKDESETQGKRTIQLGKATFFEGTGQARRLCCRVEFQE